MFVRVVAFHPYCGISPISSGMGWEHWLHENSGWKYPASTGSASRRSTPSIFRGEQERPRSTGREDGKPGADKEYGRWRMCGDRFHNPTNPNRRNPLMPIIQCDIREGWSDEQKRALASGLTKVVAEVGKVPIKSVHIVIREGRGLHFMFGGESVPEFKTAAGG